MTIDKPGFEEIDHVQINMAYPLDGVKAHLDANKKLKIRGVHLLNEWRSLRPVAIVGGGPSLRKQIPKLKEFLEIMVCGSAHDFVRDQNIHPTWCIVCDPDQIVVNYLQNVSDRTKYLVSSQCHPDVFKHLIDHQCDVYTWHCGGNFKDNMIFGENQIVIGGGCTVGTRGIVMAYHFGYTNIHLFGFDNCITSDESHAYPFYDDEQEQLKSVLDIYVGDVKFKMADYMVGQLFDFKTILIEFKDKIVFTSHGEGAITTLLNYCKQGMELQHNGTQS